MTLITEKEIKTYKHGNWRIDIETSKYMYNAWIYHKNYGIKLHMWGIEKKNDTYENFIKMVCEAIPEFTIQYENDFM